MTTTGSAVALGNSFGPPRRIWVNAECPRCGHTQYQQGPRADAHVTPERNRWDWRCFMCGHGWTGPANTRTRDSSGR